MFRIKFWLKFKMCSLTKPIQLPTGMFTFFSSSSSAYTIHIPRKLQDLKYLEMVIKESMRLYPPVPIIGRKIEEELQLEDGRIIPANSTLTINFFLMFRNPKVHSDPELFNPDRFIGEHTMDSFFSYTPFSAGSRNCIVNFNSHYSRTLSNETVGFLGSKVRNVGNEEFNFKDTSTL